MPRTTSPVIIVIRRFSRSAIAPATGPSSSAGSSVAIQTPLTAALCAAVAPTALACGVCFPASVAASTVSATMLSQSPRLDRDSAIHSRRNGRMESTPVPWRLALGSRAHGDSVSISVGQAPLLVPRTGLLG